MSCFKNILVGIDLSHCARLSLDALTPVAQDVFQRSVWLAQRTSGRLTFFSALNLTEEVLLMLEEKHRLVVIRKIEDEASQVLADLVQKASESGVAAYGRLCPGQRDGSRSLARFSARTMTWSWWGPGIPPEGGIGSSATRPRRCCAGVPVRCGCAGRSRMTGP